MPIEALYPYAIMGYSFFVTILAVYLWKLTNLNVDGTRANIEKQVAAAVIDIGNKVDAKLEGFEDVDFDQESLEQSITAIKVDLITKLDSFEQTLPDMVGTHVAMAIKGIRATEGKAIAGYVESLGIEGITEEMKEAAIEKLTLKQKAAYELMTMKVPKKTRDAHPMGAMLFDKSRGTVAQYILDSDDLSVETVKGRPRLSGGGSFNPGYNP